MADHDVRQKRNAMKRAPHLLWLIGAIMLLVGAARYSGASLPYQDPTPELLAIQNRQIESAKYTAFIGISVLVGGLAWIFIRRLSLSKNQK